MMRYTKKVMIAGTPWDFLKISVAAIWAALSGRTILVINTEE